MQKRDLTGQQAKLDCAFAFADIITREKSLWKSGLTPLSCLHWVLMRTEQSMRVPICLAWLTRLLSASLFPNLFLSKSPALFAIPSFLLFQNTSKATCAYGTDQSQE